MFSCLFLIYILAYNIIYKCYFQVNCVMGKRKPQHKRFGHKRHTHRNKYAEFSHADENLREQEVRN